MINSNFCLISHCFRDTATYSSKPTIKNFGQNAADEEVASAYPMVPSTTSYYLTFSHNTFVTDDNGQTYGWTEGLTDGRQPYQKLDRWLKKRPCHSPPTDSIGALHNCPNASGDMDKKVGGTEGYNFL